MVCQETKSIMFNVLLSGILYVLIYTSLFYFVYPIDLTESSNYLARILGSAFFFGAFSGFFTGLFAGIRVNYLNLKSPLSSGLKAGLISVIVGSILFPPFGAFVQVNIFGDKPSAFLLNLSYLTNLSLVGVWPGAFVGVITGALGGVLSSDIVQFPKESQN